MRNGHATGEYEDFLTGFVLSDGTVWGRPVGITVAGDGSLFVSDDGSNSIWHVSYIGNLAAASSKSFVRGLKHISEEQYEIPRRHLRCLIFGIFTPLISRDGSANLRLRTS